MYTRNQLVKKIGVEELKGDTNGVLRRVRENQESFDITYRGRVIARLIPVEPPADHWEDDSEEEAAEYWETVWAQMDETAAAIAKKWPHGVSAVDAVREQRRKLTPDEWVKPGE